MSRTLNLADALLLRGRRHLECGQLTSALSQFGRLAGMRELPADVAEETQSRLAEIQARRGKIRRACRHLLAALKYDRDNAGYHYRLGKLYHRRGQEFWARAETHYARALELKPGRVACLIAAGFLAIRRGDEQLGLSRLRAAVQRRPENPNVLHRLLKGLRRTGRMEEARQEMLAALFRNPRDARFRQLATGLQFHTLWLRQQKERQTTLAHQNEGPVVLQFVPGSGSPGPKKTRNARILRRDDSSPFPPPNAGTLRFPAIQ